MADKNEETKVNIIVNDSRKGKKITAVVFTLIIVVLLLYIGLNNPFENNIFPFVKLFNIYTSSSGITRAIYRLLNFDIVAAFNLNCFFVVSLPFLVYIYMGIMLKIFFNKNIFPPVKHKKTLIAVYLLLYLIFGILRNFPALEFLAPK